MARIRFSPASEFYDVLRRRVDAHFTDVRIPRTGDWRMFLKTGIIVLWALSSYVVLVFFSTSLLMAVITAFALAQALAFVGFNIAHDGAHDSYSRNKTVNRLMSFALDLIGGSQMFWRQKHNILHHTYTNLEGMDNDIQTFGLLRLSPQQPRRPWHRCQHLYAFPVYSLLILSLVTLTDFQKFFTGRIGDYRLRRTTASEAFTFFLMKSLYFSYMLVIPLLFHPVLHVLLTFLAIHLVLGLTLSLVFQMAHTVEGNAFPRPDERTGLIPSEWAVHEVETTANFSRNSRIAAWCLGGLNFQVEHHLFPRVCHVHYPAISPIVERTCRDFSISYVSHPSFWWTVAAHYRYLKILGAKSAG